MGNPKIKKKMQVQSCHRCEEKFDASKSQCPACGHWNTGQSNNEGDDQTLLLSEVEDIPLRQIKTGPWDVAFCKESPGIVSTSVTLLGGAPGAGKSTMAIQLCDEIAESEQREVFYIGAEESKGEYRSRARRLGLRNLKLIRLYPMGASSDIGGILRTRRPCAIVIDSLPGLTEDQEEAADICKTFKEYAVELDAPVIIIDHVTKDGDLAGLMALQHHVDTLLTLFPNDDTEVRTLTVRKNRYGAANFDTSLLMTGKGLVAYTEPEEDDDE